MATLCISRNRDGVDCAQHPTNRAGVAPKAAWISRLLPAHVGQFLYHTESLIRGRCPVSGGNHQASDDCPMFGVVSDVGGRRLEKTMGSYRRIQWRSRHPDRRRRTASTWLAEGFSRRPSGLPKILPHNFASSIDFGELDRRNLVARRSSYPVDLCVAPAQGRDGLA